MARTWRSFAVLFSFATGGAQELNAQSIAPTSYTTRAEKAYEAGDHIGCLSYLDSIPDDQRVRSRNQWILLRCLLANIEDQPKIDSIAALLLVKSHRFIEDMRNDGKWASNVSEVRNWRNQLRARFTHDGLKYGSLRFQDLPSDQRVILDSVEYLLSRYTTERNYGNIEMSLQAFLNNLLDRDLPMRSGQSPIAFCITHDAKDPLETLLIGGSEDPDPLKRMRRILESSIAADAVEVTSFILNTQFRDRTYQLEADLIGLAVRHRAHHILKYWFDAEMDIENRKVGLNDWKKLAPLQATPLAVAALHSSDTAMLSYALEFREMIPADTLGGLVFRAMRLEDPRSLDLLLRAEPPDHAMNELGLSYLHEAMIMDSPELLRVLYHHGWFNKLEGSLDREGSPAVHYLVTHDIQKVLNERDLLAHLRMDATDIMGFSLLHKLMFRSDTNMTVPSEVLLRTLLENNVRYLSRDKPGPVYGWTALHYAARENKPGMVRILIDHRANRSTKDTWGRTPMDVAKERAFRDVQKAM